VTGLSVLMALGGMLLPVVAQEDTIASGGSFNPPGNSPPVAVIAEKNSPQIPAVSSSHEALYRARKALANGDLETARNMIESARHLPLDESGNGDTPARVETMIARHIELAAMRTSGDSYQYNHGAAMFLLEQADGLVAYGDFETVNSLVGLARSFGVQFKQGDLNPDHVLAHLQQARSSETTAARPPVSNQRLEQAASFLSQAQLAFDQGKLDDAQRLIESVKQLDVADEAFNHLQIAPWELELKIREAKTRLGSASAQPVPATGLVQQADYYPELDQTRNAQVSAVSPVTDEIPPRNGDARGKRLYDSGISALSSQDISGALQYFRMAWQYRDQLDPQTQQDLQSKLSQLQIKSINQVSGETESVEGVDEKLRAEMFQDVIRQRAIAEKMVGQRNPRGALNHMRMTRDNIENSSLDTAGKQQLIAVVEREIAEMEQFIERNLSEIENDERNVAALDSVEADRSQRDSVERKIQSLVNDFNMLMDEQRFAEAEVIAKQAFELAPQNEAVVLMMEKSRLQGNAVRGEEIRRMKERSNEEMWTSMERNMVIDTRPDDPIRFDEDRWQTVRNRPAVGMGGYSNDKERLIWSALKNQDVSVQYNQTPLQEAISILAERCGVNMIFDTRALELEGVSVDMPVTHNISQPISVESALNIVLSGTGLVFKVEDEVVKITNKAALQANPREKTYYVGDLVVPVPDFSGNPLNMQFISPNNPSQQWTNGNNNLGQNLQDNQTVPVNMMQQMPGNQLGFGGGSAIWSGASPQVATPMYSTWGAKEVSNGGITARDFDELIDLIEETIDPDSWEVNGGTGRMRPFPSTLSLIVTTTQENQDRIQDLLTRLRELNDVQIVVEVRFIRLRDDFFERIGIDFDFKINDATGLANQAAIPDNFNDVRGPNSNVVGRAPISGALLATADLDIPFLQDSFGATAPQFGGFGADTALNFGFAILSDIEVWFLLQAAKGDQRSNVTQAPTVTMFNGQSASVFDGEQRPFVTSITPVVGDFAAAQQPVITILPEGTQLNVKAVVSGDRRFVKMTLVPFFSQITAVDTFQFAGERRVRRGGGTDLQDIIDAIGGGGNNNDGLGNNELEIVESGTTVQLPTFANTTVTTTVSVPDGGTVLLGGIKSMSEGRTERGVPFLSNVPYINRLFTNVGIGRETSSLMMMVTPRIIIQEEEEQFQVNTGN
jgi:general secretion pathway protein D